MTYEYYDEELDIWLLDIEEEDYKELLRQDEEKKKANLNDCI
jgi:hypothetical protein